MPCYTKSTKLLILAVIKGLLIMSENENSTVGYLRLEHPRNVNLLEAVGALESVRRIHRDVIHHIIQSDIPRLAVITLTDLFK